MEVKRMAFNPLVRRGLVILLSSGILLAGLFSGAGASPNAQSAGEGSAIFDLKCKSCHTIGAGPLVGPDLLGVTEKRDGAWLQRWIAEPDKMIAAGDPLATQLLAEFNNVPMPNMALTALEVESVLVFLGTAEAQPVAAGAPTTGDATQGRSLFLGETRLQHGAPACLSCHTTAGIGAFGGGALGPDLTNVYSRFGGEGLAAALNSLPFPTMQGVFAGRPLTAGEAADLLAYFAGVDQASAQTANYQFAWLGFGGFVLLLALSHFIWNKRLSGVRIPLVGR